MTVLGHPRDGEDEEEPAQEIMEVRAVSRTERGVSFGSQMKRVF